MFIVSNSSLITRINQNSKESLNQKTNDILTMFTNDMHRDLTDGETRFIKTGLDKHLICNDYFSRFDYPRMKQVSFRQMINQLSPIITKCCNSRPPYYKLNHVHFDETLTIKGTGVSKFTLDQQLHNFLLLCKQQPAHFHDIKMDVESDLYDKLLLTDETQDHYNKAYSIPVPIDPRFEIKVSVSRSKMFVNVGCSNNPLPFSPAGFGELDFLMGGMIVYLTGIAKSKFFKQRIGEWVMTNYHFNHDLEIDVPECRHTINYLREHSTIYIHELNNKKFLRHEEKRTPAKTIDEIILEEFK